LQYPALFDILIENN